MRTLVALLQIALTFLLAGGCSFAIERTQRIVSQAPYGRPPVLVGQTAKFRAGGSAQLALVDGNQNRSDPSDDGGHLAPQGDARFWVAYSPAPFVDLALSGGFFFPQARQSQTLPFPSQEIDGLGALSFEVRFLVPSDVFQVGFVGRFGAAQIAYRWDSVDVCTYGDCPPQLLEHWRGESLVWSPTAYLGIDFSAPVARNVRILGGIGADFVPSLPSKIQGDFTCVGLLCVDTRPPDSPEPDSMHSAFVGYVGVEVDMGRWVRARALIQPWISQPQGKDQFFAASLGVEMTIP